MVTKRVRRSALAQALDKLAKDILDPLNLQFLLQPGSTQERKGIPENLTATGSMARSLVIR